MTDRLTVFYDGACPLCRREIDYYRRRNGANDLEWVDLSGVRGDVVVPGLRVEDALRRMHVRRADGSFASGALAFAELWAALPAFRPIGRIMRTRLMVSLLEPLYRLFLRFRPWMQRLAADGNQEPACSTTGACDARAQTGAAPNFERRAVNRPAKSRPAAAREARTPRACADSHPSPVESAWLSRCKDRGKPPLRR